MKKLISTGSVSRLLYTLSTTGDEALKTIRPVFHETNAYGADTSRIMVKYNRYVTVTRSQWGREPNTVVYEAKSIMISIQNSSCTIVALTNEDSDAALLPGPGIHIRYDDYEKSNYLLIDFESFTLL